MDKIRSELGMTTIHLPDGRLLKAKGYDASVYHNDVVEIPGEGKFTVDWFNLDYPTPGTAERAQMKLVLLERVKPDAVAKLCLNLLDASNVDW